MTVRETARAFIINEKKQIFLFKHDFNGRNRWFTPGGGIEEGEKVLDALYRELEEELGVKKDQVTFLSNDCIEYEYTSPLRKNGKTKDYLYFVRLDKNNFDFKGFTETEARYVTGYKWMTLEDIRNEKNCVFVPHNMDEMLESFFQNNA